MNESEKVNLCAYQETTAGDGSHTSKPACSLEKAAAKLAWGRSLTSCYKIYFCLYANFLVKIILNIHNSDN